MYRPLFLFILVLVVAACRNNSQQRPKGTEKVIPEDARIKDFKLISGGTGLDSAVFTKADITVSFNISPDSTQTIHITQRGKRMINYIRKMDSAEKAIPVPYLSVSGKDTLVGFHIPNQYNNKHFFFKIKNNKATYTKTIQ
ncbi:MAG TPA: hypothetical protein VM802_02025 [Chitinophaga sp.]|uniref:hypothetical protein n=1 Tax=Chitinophaga sp. TaxID=1869181 RepID=UPI002C12F931|nr:hypothetical protein [Chitinophaga sp.]HVI43611.1 hypothetical protein [Chitinophaga sp.]